MAARAEGRRRPRHPRRASLGLSIHVPMVAATAAVAFFQKSRGHQLQVVEAGAMIEVVVNTEQWSRGQSRRRGRNRSCGRSWGHSQRGHSRSRGPWCKAKQHLLYLGAK